MEVFKVIEAKSEAELVARILSGDCKAEEELAERYRQGILIVITKATGDPVVAADLCHDTLVRTFRAIKRHRLREPEKLPAFIWGIAQHVVTEHRKKAYKNPTQVITDDQFVDSAPSQFDLLLRKENAEILHRVLNGIRAKYRELLNRYYLAEEEKGSICRDLGISERQFNVTLFRARKQLLKKLKGKL